MADQVIEKKVHLLGHWKNSHVDKETIWQINSKIAKEKGNRVKLLLSGDGIRVVKTSMIQGKMLHGYVPLAKIQFMTVSQNLPNILMVISLTNGVDKVPYEIHAFRCDNGIDAGMYMEAFRLMQKTVPSVKVVKTAVAQKTDSDEINWTLRNKGHDNSKRELKQFVDIHADKTVVHKVHEGSTVYIENTEKPVLTNGNTEVFENGVRIPLYRKGRPARLERESFETDVSDTRSEVSESALRNELETLSQELRDIKIMLEHSTGIPSVSEPGSPRDFQAVNVNVHTHTVQPEQMVVQRGVMNGEHTIETVVLDDEPVQMVHQENGYTVTGNAPVTHVRVNVPDYRNFNEGTSSYSVTTEKRDYQTINEEPSSTVTRTSAPVNTDYEVIKHRSPTTSYENWKTNTMERNAVRHSDLPERIQWKSRASRASHVTSARPRSAMPVWSTDAVDSSMVEVRHHPAGVGPAYQRVSFNPRVVKMRDRKSQSLRARGLSTTVAKPIDRVYVGRADAKHHHSLSYRPQSANFRPSILLRDTEAVQQNHVQTAVVEQNNNVVKLETDSQLLDVSGVDLYNDTPIVGAVIRT